MYEIIKKKCIHYALREEGGGLNLENIHIMLTILIFKGTEESKSYKPISELSVDWSIKTRVTFTAHQVDNW